MKKPAQHPTFRLDRFGRPAFGLVVLCALMMLAMQPAQAQTYMVLHDFSGGLDGSDPTAGLTLVGTGNLFGGAGPSAVFRVRQTGHGWVFNPIYEFNGTDGYHLAGRLSIGADGALYGASSGGGVGYGLIFSMRPTASICSSFACLWTESVLYQFDPIGGIDGNRPTGGLIFDASGNIYGTTAEGGMFGGGTVFQLTPSQGSWTETVLYNFGQWQSDGMSPNGNLVIDHAGNIIGTTARGGDPGCQCGTIFQLTHNGSGWAETILHAFTLNPDGAYPSGGLVSDAAGNLYGGTPLGGSNGLGGSVYQLMRSNGGYTFQVLYSFSSSADFEGPFGIPAIDANGTLYATTWSQGGGPGNVFKLTPANGGWIYTELHDFGGPSDGFNPPDGPTLDPSGNLYGTTTSGGTGGGVIWQLVP